MGDVDNDSSGIVVADIKAKLMKIPGTPFCSGMFSLTGYDMVQGINTSALPGYGVSTAKNYMDSGGVGRSISVDSRQI